MHIRPPPEIIRRERVCMWCSFPASDGFYTCASPVRVDARAPLALHRACGAPDISSLALFTPRSQCTRAFLHVVLYFGAFAVAFMPARHLSVWTQGPDSHSTVVVGATRPAGPLGCIELCGEGVCYGIRRPSATMNQQSCVVGASVDVPHAVCMELCSTSCATVAQSALKIMIVCSRAAWAAKQTVWSVL